MDDFAAPENNLAQLHIQEGMKVADLGSGSGHYTFAAARLVGDTGTVISVEVQKELVQRTKNEAKNQHLGNVQVLWGDIEEAQGTKIADRSVDVAFLSNVLFQVENRKATLKEASRIIKPKGRLLIVDWSDSFGGMGPQQDQIVTAVTLRKEAEGIGLVYDEAIQTGTHHYGFTMTKP